MLKHHELNDKLLSKFTLIKRFNVYRKGFNSILCVQMLFRKISTHQI